MRFTFSPAISTSVTVHSADEVVFHFLPVLEGDGVDRARSRENVAAHSRRHMVPSLATHVHSVES